MSNGKNNSLIFICDNGKSHFALPILKYLSTNSLIYHSETKYDIFHRIKSKNKKIIWVEWARRQAQYMSNYITSGQKLFIRLHRFEMDDINTLKQIKWVNVHTVIFVCTELQKQFSLLFPNVNTIMIPNAIETSLFNIKENDGKNSLLAFGAQFDPRKGYDKLIKMFSQVINKDASFSLTIAGEIPTNHINQKYFDYCSKLINELDLTEYCHLKKLIIDKCELKNQSNAKELLQNHNAIISYSESESFHYSFAEGLLSGLAGFCNGWRKLNPYEFWKDYCYNNEKKFINGLLDWGQLSITKRNKIGLENRKFIINNFASEVIGEKYRKLFFNQ